MALPPVELDPHLAEIEWDAAELAAMIEAFERQKLEEVEIDEWEAAALAATIEAFERQQLEEAEAMEEVEQRTHRRHERQHHELHREEMHKWRRVEELEQQLR